MMDTAVAAPLPVTLISGFLGAGKTTLLRHLLTDPQGVRYGVLVNDFGAINIDAELVADVAPDRIALSNGCICCSLRDDLISAALSMAVDESAPEHLLIETSGVSNPAAVAESFYAPQVAARLRVESILCLIDAAQFEALDYAATELAIDQAAVADIVLLNKCDIADPAQLEDVERTLRGALPPMRIVRTTHGQLPRAMIASRLDASAPEAGAGRPWPADHGPGFTARAWTSQHPLSRAAFEQAVAHLPPFVYRSKATLRFVEHPHEIARFHLVGKRRELTFVPAAPGAASALVTIGWRAGDPASGRCLNAADEAQLDVLFESCGLHLASQSPAHRRRNVAASTPASPSTGRIRFSPR